MAIVSPIFDRVLETSTTTGTGTLTLAGAVTGYQSFGVVGNTNKTPMAIWEVDGNGNPSGAWEVAIDCVYTVSGTTLTRGTFLASSTGSVISFGAGTKYVAQVALPALFANQMQLGTKGVIQGLEPNFRNASVVRIMAGTCSINNKVLSMAQTDYTSGSTMKDISGATVTVGNSKRYNIYAQDQSGTLGAVFENANGSGNGNDPTFDTSLDYWISPNGATERRIMSFWTDGSGNIIPFDIVSEGRIRRMVLREGGSIALVNGVNNTSFTSITLVPFVRSDDAEIKVLCSAVNSTPSAVSVIISTDGSSQSIYNFINFPVAVFTGSGQAPYIGDWLPNTQALYYKNNTGGLSYVYLTGVEQYV